MKKIDIPKEKLIEFYVKQKLTMEQIATIYSVNRTTIKNKLKLYDIPVSFDKRKFQQIKNSCISNIQEQIMVGSLLGDASLIKRNKSPYFKVAHCKAQKNYVSYLYDNLRNLTNMKISEIIDKRQNSIMYSFNTLENNSLNYLHNLFYVNKQKVISDKLKDYLTPLGLAIWFMDDGSKNKNSSSFHTERIFV